MFKPGAKVDSPDDFWRPEENRKMGRNKPTIMAYPDPVSFHHSSKDSGIFHLKLMLWKEKVSEVLWMSWMNWFYEKLFLYAWNWMLFNRGNVVCCFWDVPYSGRENRFKFEGEHFTTSSSLLGSQFVWMLACVKCICGQWRNSKKVVKNWTLDENQA